MTHVTGMTLLAGDQPMPENGQLARTTLNPIVLSIEDAARVLSAAGGRLVTEAMLKLDIAEGAPHEHR